MMMSGTGNKRDFRPGVCRCFTLVEVLLAVSILAIGIVGVLGAYMKSSDTLRLAQQHLVAFDLLRQQMAEVQLSLLERPEADGLRLPSRFQARHDEFESLLELRPATSDGPMELIVTVTHRRDQRRYSLATMIPRPSR